MKPSVEISIDLSAQELLDPPPLSSMIEVDDIGDIDPLLRTGSFVANADRSAQTGSVPAVVEAEIAVEIELTAEQMDDLLGPPRR